MKKHLAFLATKWNSMQVCVIKETTHGKTLLKRVANLIHWQTKLSKKRLLMTLEPLFVLYSIRYTFRNIYY